MSITKHSYKVSFIGLGVMGYPMAGHLSKAGHDVVVYNRNPERSNQWNNEYKGKIADSPAEASKDRDFIFSCVGADNDLRDITYGKSGVISGISHNSVFVDHTTASADVAREINTAIIDAGANFLDAPVSGGQAGAENGQLTIMIGGDKNTFENAKPVMEVYARNLTYMGPSGNGQLTKMVNQICIAGVLQGLSEGLAFSQNAGLDGNLVLDVISKGAAQSWQMENRGTTMLEGKFDFGFAVDWMRKDLNLCMTEAQNNGSLLPCSALVDQFYANVQQRGGSRWDTSSLIDLLQNLKT
ncbi:MAG: oxidoreductase [Gammaproteobacteria bacterium]|jgi:3-hydroxyisobutyrate dehydrogenase|nr:oxidoreductase [Gammaproteobacteria bacterium]|tara:strand:+ start:3249 stop:4142 length:894 start_codon:yes stop_codon:yes gene_type:complete